MDDEHDELTRAWAWLDALNKGIAASDYHKDGHPLWELAEDFHRGLDHLDAAGFDVAEFRLPASARKDFSAKGGRVIVDYHVLGSRVAAALNYFGARRALESLVQTTLADPAKLIGYDLPKRRSTDDA